MSRRASGAVALAIAALLGAAGPAPARPELRAAGISPHPGWIGLRVAGGVPRSPVSVREGDALLARIRLDARGRAAAGRVAPWSCTQRVRTLTVHGVRGAAAAVTVKTPGCDRRLALRVRPRRPRAGGPLTIRVIDRWRLGDVDACLALVSPAGAEACRPARVRRRGAAIRLTAPRVGRWTVELRAPGIALRRRVGIRPRRGRLSVLAAGDSMMAPVAWALRKLLAAERAGEVRSDIHYGAGISTSFVMDWREHALATTPRWKPDVVVLFIGGHEGWPFGPVSCCGADWIAQFAARTQGILRAYMQDGAAQVYVLSLPAPAEAARVFPLLAVNAGLEQAVAGLGSGARVLDMSAVFTPGFQYRSTMLVDGLITVVRHEDGLHLSHGGAAVASRTILGAFAADAILPS